MPTGPAAAMASASTATTSKCRAKPADACSCRRAKQTPARVDNAPSEALRMAGYYGR
jgi:hypothetical protein